MFNVYKAMSYFISFPLFNADGMPIFEVRHNEVQKKALRDFSEKINSGFYRLTKNNCLCGASSPDWDVVVAKKDRHGISIESVLCQRCGIIRLKNTLDATSMNSFYENDYRKIYSGIENFNTEEKKFKIPDDERGLNFIKILEKIGVFGEIKKVFDFGCGSGHALVPFYRRGIDVLGCDPGKSSKFITLTGERNGVVNAKSCNTPIIEDASQDLIIMSQVMEHLVNPLEDLLQLIKKITPGKYLLIGVPGIYWLSNSDDFNSDNPVVYFQNAHVVQFYYEDYLQCLFKQLGLTVLYSNEECIFVLQKPQNYSDVCVGFIYDHKMRSHATKIERYLKTCYIKWRIHHIKNKITRIKYKTLAKLLIVFNLLGIKKFFKKNRKM